MTGIVSYGFYVPKYRITIEAIAAVWGKKAPEIVGSLRLTEKAVAGVDEDSLTMGFESATMALSDMALNRTDIGAVFFGSETPPYAVNPASTILGEFLQVGNNYLAYDTQFACKAATGATISGLSLVASKKVPYVLVTAADKATGRPHDALEYTAASGSVSLLLGDKDVAVEVIDSASFSSDTPDFWRREGIRYPSHGGRFTGKPSYFHHVRSASLTLLEKNKMKASDFAQAVFHMPNGRFPADVAASLGFTPEQIKNSLVVSNLGNSYTASALMGLVSVLETVKPGEHIFFASYGSGAGSDAFIFRATEQLEKRRRAFSKQIQNKEYIDYTTYLKFMGMI